MKNLLFILFLFFAVYSNGQYAFQWQHAKPHDTCGIQKIEICRDCMAGGFGDWDFDTDTLIVPPYVRFIKIDGKVFEIARQISVTEVKKKDTVLQTVISPFRPYLDADFIPPTYQNILGHWVKKDTASGLLIPNKGFLDSVLHKRNTLYTLPLPQQSDY